MKLVLRENVENLGRRGDVVRVAAGYGRNYLLPRKLAYVATPGTLRQVQAESRKRAFQEARERDAATLLAERIMALGPLTFEKKVGEEGTLYGSVTAAEIADRLEEKGCEVDRRRITLAAPIKKAGSHRVAVHLFHDVSVELVLDVVPEG